MKRILFIGDVHCNFELMEYLIDKIKLENHFDKIVQVGDFGYFPNYEYDKSKVIVLSKHKSIHGIEFPKEKFCDEQFFIQGNHDHHSELLKLDQSKISKTVYPHWNHVPSGYLDDDGIFYVGGAESVIDAHYKTELKKWLDKVNAANGTDYPLFDEWQKNLEQLSDQRMQQIIEFAKKNSDKIKILVSHDTDTRTYWKYFRDTAVPGRTPELITNILGVCNPEYHLFGHHHKQGEWPSEINGTKQIQLNTVERVEDLTDLTLLDQYLKAQFNSNVPDNPFYIKWNGWYKILEV